jgi:TonB family protein
MRFLAAFTLCALLASLSTSFAEDAQLRARAFELVERAHEVSTPRQSAPIVNETVLTFHALGADGSMREGSYSRVFAGPTGTRQEFSSADFHLVKIDLPDRVAFIGKSRVLPPEFREMLRLLPIQLWHLDREDVIREIKKTSRKGVDAQCVEFDTIRGPDTFNNEFCFDAGSGAQSYVKSGNMELENSAFFDFAGAKLPGHIMQYRNGTLVMDVQLTRRVITDQVSPDMFTPPAAADIGVRCKTYRRGFGQSMPQPAAGNGAAVTEIVVHALIGLDGKVQEAAVEDSDRPDLNEEALKTARSWTFTPATCNGRPNQQEANLVIRFQGW